MSRQTTGIANLIIGIHGNVKKATRIANLIIGIYENVKKATREVNICTNSQKYWKLIDGSIKTPKLVGSNPLGQDVISLKFFPPKKKNFADIFWIGSYLSIVFFFKLEPKKSIGRT